MTIAVLTAGMPTGLTAAIDRSEVLPPPPQPLRQWTFAQSTTPPAEAVVPPVKRERPGAVPPLKTEPAPASPGATTQPTVPQPAEEAAAPAAQPEAAPQPDAGIFGLVQDWLARANREYQGVVVKQLSLPQPGQTPQSEDPIAKKLQEQQDEDARKTAAKVAARKAAEAKAAADAKAAIAKRLAEDRRRAEETKRLADEAKRKADEILKAAEKQASPQREVAAPVATVPAPAASDAAGETAEQQRREAAKLAEEARRQDALRQAEEARRQEAERKRAEAARLDAARLEIERADAARVQQQRAAEARRTSAAGGAEVHRRRTFVLTAEPIERPVDRGTVFRPEMASRTTDGDVGSAVGGRRLMRGTAVKRWVWRDGNHGCRAAGRRVMPPARYTVQRGDSLWRISKRHYRNGRLYKKIYRANRGTIRNPNLIYPCQRVLVPRKS